MDYRLFTAAEIRRHVRTYFAAGNAVLALTADPPPALRLPLPAGPRVTRTAPAVPHQAGPGWYADEVGGVGLAFRAAPGVAALILFRLLKARTDAALARAGVACLADPVYLPVDDTTHEYGLVVRLQGRKAAKHAARAAEVLWTELRRLAHDGLDQAELDREAASLEDTPQAQVRALQEERRGRRRRRWRALDPAA
ncbi:hypothetical protein ACL02O_04460 [Micromonospora sp. MS34]|uniref:hypothetical protein n=1 Tax=Micromonospora sp. MS34 TaxID=3385971 RepID=UPI0039A276BB